MKYKITLSFLISLFSLPAMATVVYVDSAHVGGTQNGTSWTTAFANFQTGINAANAGDSVFVAKGTYTPAVNTNFVMKEGVKIFGGFLNTNNSFAQRDWLLNQSILKVTGNSSGVIRNNSNNLTPAAVLNGFVITGSTGIYNASSSPNIVNCIFSDMVTYFGAVYNANATASPVIDNCVFFNNSGSICAGINNLGTRTSIINCNFTNNSWDNIPTAAGGGGAIRNIGDSVVINNCIFYNNSYNISGGGAIYNLHASSPTISNCSFNNNISISNGGAIYNSQSSPVITNCTFSNNIAVRGGAIYNAAIGTTPASNALTSPIIRNCNFYNNNATYGGGAIYNNKNASLIENCNFTDNSCNSNQGTSGGGAIYNEQTAFTSTISKSTFTGNKAIGSTGGAIYNGYKISNCRFIADSAKMGGAVAGSGFVTNCLFSQNFADSAGGALYASANLINCTIVRNKAMVNGSAIYGTPKINNTILWGNYSGIYNPNNTPIAATYSLIQDLPANPSLFLLNGTTNPLFIDTSGTGNYHLQNSSPCINAGRNDSIPSGITTDLAGNTRIYGGTVDMGVYETGNFPPSVNLGFDTSFCAGNTILLNAQNPGATYFWNTGATTQTIAVNSSGTYYVAVTNAYGTNTDTINIIVNPLPGVNLGNDTSFCVENMLTLNAQNIGSSYIWSNTTTTQTIQVNSTGTYYVKVTNAYQCVGKDTINITVNPSPVIVNLGNDTAICTGNTITLNAQNAGASYLWSNAATSQTITTNTSGSYRVVVIDANGCKGRDTIQVTVNPLPVVHLGNDTAFCAGNTITLNAQNAGASYLWNNAATSQTIAVNTSGNYNVVVTNANGCKGRDTIQVTVNPLPVVNIGNDTAFCAGNTITLNAQNTGASYLWNNAATSQTIAVNTSGNYNVVVTNANGCKGRDTIQVTVNSLPVVNIGNDTAFCAGNTIVLDAQNTGASYLWNNAATSQTIAVNTSGNYNVVVTNANGCKGRDTIQVTVNSLPVVDLGNDTAFCAGNTITLNAQNAGASYLWNNAATSQTIAVNTSGNYNVVVTNANGCKGRDTIQVTVNSLPVVDLGNDTAFCAGNTIVLDAQNTGASYLWNNVITSQTINVDSTGSYYVTVTDTNGCNNIDTIQVTINPLPVVNLGNDTTITTGASLTLDAGNAGATYLWNTSATTQTITVTSTGTYSVTVINDNGCGATDSITVTANPVGIDDVNKGNTTFTIMPNPAKETVYINISDTKLLHTTATLTDAYGRVIKEIMMNSKSQAVSLTGLINGIYVLKMQSGQALKVIKE